MTNVDEIIRTVREVINKARPVTPDDIAFIAICTVLDCIKDPSNAMMSAARELSYDFMSNDAKIVWQSMLAVLRSEITKYCGEVQCK